MAMQYEVVDVFADEPLQGNPLTVLPDAAALTTSQMQAIASETNHSETTFVLGRQDETWRVRIFTPRSELPFAGHPTLGTADVLRRLHGLDEVVLRFGAGDVPVRAEGDVLWMTQQPPRFGPRMEPDSMAPLLGLQGKQVLAAQVVDTGLPFWVVELANTEALGRSRLNGEALVAVSECPQVLLFARTGDGVQCRMYAHEWGVAEDPATGSANGCLAAYLAREGPVDLVSRQGVEMGRPSRLFLRAKGEHIEVGGRVVPVAAGRFLL